MSRRRELATSIDDSVICAAISTARLSFSTTMSQTHADDLGH